MAECNNDMGEIQGLIQSVLRKQEQQSNLLQENHLQNRSIINELGEMNRKLASLGYAPLSDHEESLGSIRDDHSSLPVISHEESLGSIRDDHAGLPVISREEGDFIESQENNSNEEFQDAIQGQGLAGEIEKQMEKLKLASPNASIAPNILTLDKTASEGQGLAGDIEKQMEKLGVKVSNASIDLEANNNTTAKVEAGNAENSGLKGRIRVLEANARTGDMRCRELEERLQLLQQTLHSKETALDELQHQCGKLRQEKNEMELSLARQARGQLGGGQGDSEEVRGDNNRLQERVTELIQQKQELDQRNDLLQKEMDRVKNNQQEKDEMVEALLEDKKYYTSKVQKQEKKIDELRPQADRMEIFRNHCNTLEAEKRGMDQSYQKRMAEYESRLGRTSDLLTQCERQKAELTRVRSEFDTQKFELDQGRVSVQNYERVIREKDDRIMQGRKDYEDLKEGIEVNVNCLQSDLGMQVNKCKGQQEENARLRAELEKMTAEFKEVQIKLEGNKNNEQQLSYPPFYSLNPGLMSGAGAQAPLSYSPHQPNSSFFPSSQDQ